MLTVQELETLRRQTVLVRNNVKRNIVLVIPGTSNVEYVWRAYGQIQPMPFTHFEAVAWEPAGRSLFLDGALVVENMPAAYEAVGLPIDIKYLINDKRALEILKGSAQDLEQALANAPKANKEILWQTAVENRITDFHKVQLIKKYCDIDIIEAIKYKEENSAVATTTAPVSKIAPKTGSNSI